MRLFWATYEIKLIRASLVPGPVGAIVIAFVVSSAIQSETFGALSTTWRSDQMCGYRAEILQHCTILPGSIDFKHFNQQVTILAPTPLGSVSRPFSGTNFHLSGQCLTAARIMDTIDYSCVKGTTKAGIDPFFTRSRKVSWLRCKAHDALSVVKQEIGCESIPYLFTKSGRERERSCTYMYVYMYVCMYVCMHACMSVCMFVCLYSVCMYVYMPVCLYVCYVCMSV